MSSSTERLPLVPVSAQPASQSSSVVSQGSGMGRVWTTIGSHLTQLLVSIIGTPLFMIAGVIGSAYYAGKLTFAQSSDQDKRELAMYGCLVVPLVGNYCMKTFLND
jgi:hypothetical protein